MKLVLVGLKSLDDTRVVGDEETYFEVTQLCKLFPTVIQLASEGLDLLMHDLVSPNITPLSERFPADLTLVRTLSSVAPLMRLQVAKLRERLTAGFAVL